MCVPCLADSQLSDKCPGEHKTVLAGHRPANSGVKCAGNSGRQVQPAPFALSEFPQLAGAPTVALVTRLGDLPAAATPLAVSVHQVEPGLAGRRWRSLALSSARLPLNPAGSAVPGLPSAIQSVARGCSARVSLSGAEGPRARLRSPRDG